MEAGYRNMIMGVLFTLALTGLLSLPVIFRKYGQDTGEKTEKKNAVLIWLQGFGLWTADRILRKKQAELSEEQQMAGALFVRDSPQERFRKLLARRVIWIWLGFTACCFLGAIFSFLPEAGSRLSSPLLDRPAFGKNKSVSLEVEGIVEEPQPIRVSVSGQEPGDQEMQAVFDSVFETLRSEILGENISSEEVRSDLKFPSVTDYGIRVKYESLNPEYISDRGALRSENIPEEGVVVTIRVCLSYAAMEALYLLYLHCFPPKRDEAFLLGLLNDRLAESDAEGIRDPWIELPETLEGRNLSYSYSRKKHPWIVLLLLAGAGILKAFADRQNLRREFEKRRFELAGDYPALCFQLSVLVSCGMTVLGAWNKITDNYLRKQERKPGWKKYLYEEMVTTRNQIHSGAGETESYHSFGLRCGQDCYLRLTGFIEHNIRQGIAGLQAALEAELSQSLETRKNMMLQLGERMNTKLLLPMLLMLGVVIAVLVAPAILGLR